MLTEAHLRETLERVWDDELHLLDNAENVATWIEGKLDMSPGNTTDLADAIADGVRESVVPFEFLNFDQATRSVMQCLKTGGWLG